MDRNGSSQKLAGTSRIYRLTHESVLSMELPNVLARTGACIGFACTQCRIALGDDRTYAALTRTEAPSQADVLEPDKKLWHACAVSAFCTFCAAVLASGLT